SAPTSPGASAIRPSPASTCPLPGLMRRFPSGPSFPSSPCSRTASIPAGWNWRRRNNIPQEPDVPLLRIVVLVLACFAASSLFAEDVKDRWNLTDLYPTLDAWNADATKLEAQLKQLAACKGHLGESGKRFKTCLDLNADASKRYARLAVYSSQTLDEDTGRAA